MEKLISVVAAMGVPAFLGFPGSGEGRAQEASPEYLSHAPIRPMLPVGHRPMGDGPGFFVDPIQGADANPGSEKEPWKTIHHALRQLGPGDTLYLRQGTYFENVYCAVAGTKEAPITLRAYPGERVIIDGGIPEFQLTPSAAWQPYPEGAPGEYISRGTFRNIRDVVGLFGDSNIGLQTYWYAQDLRAANEYWIPDEKDMVQPIYCGPGIWYDKQSGRIHVRLAHTHIKPSEHHNYRDVNYTGETDPRRLPLVLAPFDSVPLYVDQAMHVRFQDLVIRGGAYRTVHLNFGVDLEFDNCTIYCGTYGIWTKGTGPLKMTNCGVYGMIPPWGIRSENSLYVYSSHKYPPFLPDEEGGRHISRLPTHAILVPAGGFEFEVFYYPYDHDWDISHCEFSDSHDGIYLSGHNIRFHHNWVNTLQDDGIYISSPTPYRTESVHIYQNYLTSGITAFGAHARGGPGGDVFIYRNVIDLRKPMQWDRPTEEHPEGTFEYGHSAFFMHSSNHLIHEEAIHFYQNTCLMRSPNYACAMAYSLMPDTPRRVFNNLFLYADLKPQVFALKDPQKYDLQMDGNLHWHLTSGADPAAAVRDQVRQLPLSEESRQGCPNGLEANSLVEDPRLRSVRWDREAINDYRLQPGSPAIEQGRVLPPEYEDPWRSEESRRPDIGALPAGCEPLRVGIQGRVIVGRLSLED